MHAAMLESMNGDATMRDSMEASLRALPTEYWCRRRQVDQRMVNRDADYGRLHVPK